MAPAARLKVLARAALLGAALALLAGCSLFGGKDDETNNANKDAANYRERSVEQIYADGWRAINAGAWDVCAAQFNEVDRQHPYSVWARRAMLISAFCSYQANAYPIAIATADQYISLHPGSPEVAYALYIKSLSLYEQIVDIGRDQSNTDGALVALQDVVQRFPDTEYARDATLKIDLTNDHLAGKEMAVGRYYLSRGDYIGAINRFRTVRSEEHTSELQSHRDLHSFPTRRSSDLDRPDQRPSGGQGNGGGALLPVARRLYRRHQPLPHRGGPVSDHAADRRVAGAHLRGLLQPGPGQRGADRGGGAGAQLSRLGLVQGRL